MIKTGNDVTKFDENKILFFPFLKNKVLFKLETKLEKFTRTENSYAKKFCFKTCQIFYLLVRVQVIWSKRQIQSIVQQMLLLKTSEDKIDYIYILKVAKISISKQRLFYDTNDST